MHLATAYRHGGKLSLANAAYGCRHHHRLYDAGQLKLVWRNNRPVLKQPDPDTTPTGNDAEPGDPGPTGDTGPDGDTGPPRDAKPGDEAEPHEAKPRGDTGPTGDAGPSGIEPGEP